MIDAHQHFWKLGQFDYGWLETEAHTPIRRDFLPADLEPLLDEAGIAKSVIVQTQHDLGENDWALQLADGNDRIAGVVGWVDLASDDCESQIESYKDRDKFVGIRHITQDEPDDDFIIRPDVIRGLRVLEKYNVPFDLLFYVKHLHHARQLAEILPKLPMVIDHISKPEIKAGNIDNWKGNLQAAAKFPNVYCKLSGMITEADWQNWTPQDLKPYVDIALEAFGPSRCMFGSDWPVCTLAGSYQQVYDALCEVLGPISDDERSQIFGRTAMSFYGLG
ncbi:MAG: amidohydrolase family protein [Planctomycetales bacterium]|nr:amidohydrolase family protein [Planctomycetales bacterium]